MTLAPPFLSCTCLPFLILAHTLVLRPPNCQRAAIDETGSGGERVMAAIAYRVGFASQSHFTTIFRRWVGTTPRQYRQQR